MSERGPWSVKGIDQRAREAARDAARMEGVTLGEYLNKLILEVSSDAHPNEIRSSHAYPRSESALDQLARRVEAVEARSTLAITGIDQSVMGLVARLEKTEDNNSVIASHVDGFIDELRETHAALSDKVSQMEADDRGEQNLEALRSLEQALGKLATHVYEEGERQQEEGDAIRGRVEAGFANITDRVEQVETRVETTLSEAARRVEKAVEEAELRTEGSQRDLAKRFDALEQAVGEQAAGKGESDARLASVEEDVSGALGSMEQTLLRIQERLNRAERTTDAALKGLEGTFDSLDERLNALTETAGPEAVQKLRAEFESRFEGLAGELKAEIDASREAMAREISEATAADLSPEVSDLRSSVESLSDRFGESEARSAAAFQSVGDQVARISESFDKRLETLEGQDADGPDAEALRQEIASVSERVDARLDEIETREASVIERVGEEVGKLADRLEARVTESEAASARAIGQIGDQVASVAKRLQSRQNEAFDALSTKMEDSRLDHEARLSDALESMSERFEQLHTDTSHQVSPVQKAIASLADRLDQLERAGQPDDAFEAPISENEDVLVAFSAALEEVTSEAAQQPVPKAVGDEGFEPGVPTWALPVEDEDEIIEDVVDTLVEGQPETYDPLAALEDWDEGASDLMEDEVRDSDIFDPELALEVGPPAHLDLDQDMPRATLEESGLLDDSELMTADDEADASDVGLEEDLDASDYIARARKAALAASPAENKHAGTSGSFLGGRAPLYAAASVIVLAAAGTTGYLYLRGKQAMPEHVPAAEAASVVDTPAEPVIAEPVEPPVIVPEASGEPDVEMAPTPEEAVPAEPVSVEPEAEQQPVRFAPIPEPITLERAATEGDRIAQYELGVQYLSDSRYAEAANMISLSAEQGLPVAQYRLSKLHEKGLGLPRDLAAARQWTERAAAGGNVAAMHDLAVYYADGEGGTQSYASAAEWFRKASEYGVLDSQYNLGVLYQQGLGLTADPSEALFWFSVAAEKGDMGAPEQVRAMLARVDGSAARSVRDRVQAWSAATPNGPANGEFGRQVWQGGGGERMRAVQTALGALGYDVGAPDGVFGPATRDAIRQYQAQAGLSETGTLTAELVDSLNARAARTGG
ncbi:MAG: peptidoglycan-binding protein [Hyphomonadaceae bacterium]|nr:peptidoglycan-binding protein [Hyphomonadaceae bacterium]